MIDIVNMVHLHRINIRTSPHMHAAASNAASAKSAPNAHDRALMLLAMRNNRAVMEMETVL